MVDSGLGVPGSFASSTWPVARCARARAGESSGSPAAAKPAAASSRRRSRYTASGVISDGGGLGRVSNV